jgi:hypothetical protein
MDTLPTFRKLFGAVAPVCQRIPTSGEQGLEEVVCLHMNPTAGIESIL